MAIFSVRCASMSPTTSLKSTKSRDIKQRKRSASRERHKPAREKRKRRAMMTKKAPRSQVMMT